MAGVLSIAMDRFCRVAAVGCSGAMQSQSSLHRSKAYEQEPGVPAVMLSSDAAFVLSLSDRCFSPTAQSKMQHLGKQKHWSFSCSRQERCEVSSLHRNREKTLYWALTGLTQLWHKEMKVSSTAWEALMQQSLQWTSARLISTKPESGAPVWLT